MIVKETAEAFSSLVNFIYDVPGYISSPDDRQKLAEILNVAEKYQATRLVDEIKEKLIRIPTKVEILPDIQDIIENTIEDKNMSEDNVFENENSIKVENVSEDIFYNENIIKIENASYASVKHKNALE